MQNLSESNLNMFPQDGGAELSPTNNNVETSRSVNPRNSLDDYNRTMLEYTQRQMSSFFDHDEGSGSSGSSSRSSHSGNSGASSRSSLSSGNGGAFNNGVARQANGPPPTSASAARHATEKAKLKSSQNMTETKDFGY
jgi:hypothetical protein